MKKIYSNLVGCAMISLPISLNFIIHKYKAHESYTYSWLLLVQNVLHEFMSV